MAYKTIMKSTPNHNSGTAPKRRKARRQAIPDRDAPASAMREEMAQSTKHCAFFSGSQTYKREFIEFIVETKALQFGSFTLKSGRQAPYFFNAGAFCTGDSITRLGEYYAAAAKDSKIDFDVIFGPAYKGIPLAVSCACALFTKHNMTVSYAFNRKEKKEYGMKDLIVGAKLGKGSRVLLIDDVITAGTAVRESADILASVGVPKLSGILIALDRMELNNEGENAISSIEKEFKTPVFSIVNLDEMIGYLYNKSIKGEIYIDDVKMAEIKEYRKKYGVK